MNFRTWTPLWSMIVDSSLWQEPDYVIKIYLTMIALKDEDHVYRGTAFGLGKRANKTEQEVIDALKILSSPDTRRKERQQFEGRRIEPVDDGWFILNGPKYRELVAVEMKRARDRRSAKAYRDRKRGSVSKRGSYEAGEQSYERAINNGSTDAQAMAKAQEVHPLPERKVYSDDPPDNF